MAIGSDLDLAAVLRRLVAAAADLVDARYGALAVLDETKTGMAEFLTVGLDDDTYRAIGDLPRGQGVLGLLIVEPSPLRLPDLREHVDSYGFPPNHPPMRSFLGVPIRVRNEVFGNLYLTDKTTAEVFSDVDEELVVGLAGAAGIAIENARLHRRLSELALLEDHERIARDLHDTVIQRLFATGLSLQAAARVAAPSDVVDRIQRAVRDLDDTLKHIRTVIFGLEATAASGGAIQGLRAQVMSLAREATGALGFTPRVAFGGPVDTLVDEKTATELLATLREALSNVARHAAATGVDIGVMAEKDIILRVSDDGCGIGDVATGKGYGLRNMSVRAEDLGGWFEVRTGKKGGTQLEWRIPTHLHRPDHEA
jgi:signal transduction histidine kinase